jgi:hypothetical protein
VNAIRLENARWPRGRDERARSIGRLDENGLEVELLAGASRTVGTTRVMVRTKASGTICTVTVTSSPAGVSVRVMSSPWNWRSSAASWYDSNGCPVKLVRE